MPRFCRPRTWQLNRAIGIFFSNDQFLFTMCTFSKKSLLLWIETFIAMSCDCIFPRDPVLERLHRFKIIAYCSFPRLRNPGCLLLVAIFAVLWENAVPSESFLACLRRRLQHFHNPCKFFFLSRGTVLLWCAGFVRRYLVRQTFWMFSKYLPASVVLKIIHLLLFDFWSPYSFVSFQWLLNTIDDKSQSKSHDNSAG